MELRNEFEVAMPLEDAWAVLTDVERIAPCMPGAELRDVEDGEYKGVVKVKVGPITAEYRGAVRFVEKDGSAHHAVLRAEGRETRGQGNASADIKASLESSGTRTKVVVTTDLKITGRVAQLGRGVLSDVSNNLLRQFVQNLESTLAEPGEPGAGTSEVNGSSPRPAASPRPATAVDLLQVAGRPLARRLAPVLGAGVLISALVVLLRRLLSAERTDRAR
jgi:carbon monoxide dehydrogenase subunit G